MARRTARAMWCTCAPTDGLSRRARP
jgi:hypothetical protein